MASRSARVEARVVRVSVIDAFCRSIVERRD